ncbi:MAG: iron transporter, partial [Candidatus Obscuribacterales bacterium]|nr:iron transporter [Candidatus Obscuribacterales bacterium]
MRFGKTSMFFITAAALSIALPAFAQFNVGDSVIISPGFGDYPGVVTETKGGPSGMIRVRLAKASPDTPGTWYNPNNLKPGGGGGGNNNAAQQPAQCQPAAPGMQPPRVQASPIETPRGFTPANNATAPGGAGGPFKIGDNVIILDKYEGTVTAINGPSGTIQVKLTTSPANNPGAWFNPNNVKLGGGGSHGGTKVDGGNVGGKAPAHPSGDAVNKPIQVPNNAPSSVETFKKIIESHAVPDFGETSYFDFNEFTFKGDIPFFDPYAGNPGAGETQMGGAGLTYAAKEYHVKYTILPPSENKHAHFGRHTDRL